MTRLTRKEVEKMVQTARRKGERPDLSRADLMEVDLRGINFGDVDLSFANLGRAKLQGTNLTDANLARATLIKANLTAANLHRADLSEADLRKAILADADLTQTDLRWARLGEAYLIRADLRSANLNEADLTGAYLRGAYLKEATLGYTILGDLDLREVRGLKTVKHAGPSTIGVDTLYRSNGQIPEAFLRGAGIPDNLIDYIPSLIGQPIQYYSCFISYAAKDQAFARRLYADLQNEGVRCWYAPEDMKIGDKTRPALDQTIRVHDKLLLILSKHSVASQWVEQEVETALARERQQAESILFPVRLDEAVTKEESGWAALIQNTRHIGDFTKWKEHDAYQRGFEQLLKELKTGGVES